MPCAVTSCRSLAELRPIPRASSPILGDNSDLFDNREISCLPLARIEIEGQAFDKFKQLIKIPVRRDQFIKIGSDKEKSNLRIKNASVSPIHCEIYSVVFESGENCLPLLYVRDCQSTTGTYVNGHSIGQGPLITAATLLENNDTIRVGSCTLRVCDYKPQGGHMALSRAQRKEALLFRDHFVVKDTVLGYGSLAAVHLAVDVKTNRQVICKVHDLEKLRILGPSATRCVDQETSIWSYLDHPNIIAFRRAFRTSRSTFTFAELATGGDLFSLLERRKVLPELEIKCIIKQVLNAVVYLHSKGVAHQDIKPENVLCTISPLATHRIALTDFGCSEVTSLGIMRSDIGSFPYRAPEVQLADGRHGVAVDIWSIGALMLQLISGTHPINMLAELVDMSEVEKFVWSVAYRRIQSVGAPISDSGLSFLMSCLNLDPSRRPSAMKASGHEWLKEHDPERSLSEERERQLAWKPRDILIPAIVDLREATTAAFLDNHYDMDNSSESAEPPNSVCDNNRSAQEMLPASRETDCLNPHLQFHERSQTMDLTNWNRPATICRKRSVP